MKIDTEALIRLIIGKFPQTFAVAIVFAMAGFGLSFLFPEVFSAQTKIFVSKGGASGGLDLQGISAWANFLGGKSGEEERIMTILNSVTLARNVIKDLGLDKMEDIIPPDFKDNPIRQMAALRNKVSINNNKNGQITIVAKTPDPELSVKIANNFVSQLDGYYTSSSIEEKKQLRNLLDSLRDTTLDIENKMLAMQGENEDLLALDDQSKQLVTTYSEITNKKMEGEVSKRMMERVRREAGSVAIASQLNRRLLEQNVTLEVYNEFLSQYREKLKKLPSTYIEYSKFKKDLLFYETLYSAILGKYESTEIKLKLGTDEFEVIDWAVPNDERESPIRRNFALAGFALGLVVSGIVFILPRQKLFLIPVEDGQKD